MNVDAMHVANPSTNEDSVLGGLIDPSMDMSTGTWPWLETLSRDDMQLEGDWSNHDSSYVDAVLASLDAFKGDGSARESPDPPSPTQPPCPPSPCHPYAYAYGQPGGGIFEKPDGRSRSNMDRSNRGGGGGTLNMSLDKNMNFPSLVIAQLSQLSMRLSLLRYSSYTLAKAAESSSYRLPNGRQIPLIDTVTFESVAAWLAHGHGSANVNAHPPVHAHTESQGPYPSPTSETKPRGGHGILHDVFSASHHLLEILRQLQVNNIIEPFSSSTTTSASTPSTAASGQSSALFGLTKGPGSSTPSSGSQQHCNNTMQIIRYLVIACEALLLEIYVAVLNALQHDAYPSASMNTTALGDVRLVLVVELCSYLIERQHQAVDSCLAPQSPLSPVSVSGPFSQKLDLSGSHQQVPPGPVLDTADREVLNDLKNQVQQRLVHLRQTLRCT